MGDSIRTKKLKSYNPSMNVPGKGKVERPLGMDNMGGLDSGRASRNARHFADVMGPYGGDAESVDSQYEKK